MEQEQPDKVQNDDGGKKDIIDSDNKKTIIIGINGESFSSKFLISWTNTLSHLWKLNAYNIIISSGSNSYRPFARMQTLGLNVMRGDNQKPFDNLKYDVFVTIDSTMIFTPDQLIDLINSTDNHPVVSGIYRLEDLNNLSAVKDWDVSYYIKNGAYKYLTQETIDEWTSETELKYMPVDYTQLGFFACRSEVIDKMKYPYFDGDIKEFVLEDGKIIRDMASDDVNFCKNIKKAGYNIFVNTAIRVGNVKSLVI